jgi:limonene-1,2-epoxide hydrolase
MSALDTVRSFIAAIEARDLDAAGALLAQDVVYHNVPIDPIHGRDATIAMLGMFSAPCTAIEWVVVRELEQGNVVINERVDRFGYPNGWLDLPVMGVWEVGDDGLITLWRDYFDMGTYMNRLAELTADGA